MKNIAVISVIIPMYNRLALTQRAIKSVLAQTYADLELIVVDDGSREEIFVPEPDTDPRLRVVRHEVNRGLSCARNTGVEAARGKILAFLDSDDYWFPEKLQRQIDLYEKQTDRDKVFIYSAYYYEINGKWIPEPFTFLKQGKPLSDYIFIDYGDIHPSVWFGSRALFQEFPSAPEMKRHEDWDMLMRMAAGGVRFVHSPIPLGVRAADLRSDRLSTVPVLAMLNLFLKRNALRMTNATRVLLEAANISVQNPKWTFLQRQYHQLRYFATSSLLTPRARASLIFRYLKARALNKVRAFLRRQPPRSVKFS